MRDTEGSSPLWLTEGATGICPLFVCGHSIPSRHDANIPRGGPPSQANSRNSNSRPSLQPGCGHMVQALPIRHTHVRQGFRAKLGVLAAVSKRSELLENAMAKLLVLPGAQRGSACRAQA